MTDTAAGVQAGAADFSAFIASDIAAELVAALDVAGAGARARFGARDDDTMPLSWADRGLTWLHDTHPEIFAAMMCHVTGLEWSPPAAARSHKKASGVA
jgi:hypothetical protein